MRSAGNSYISIREEHFPNWRAAIDDEAKCRIAVDICEKSCYNQLDKMCLFPKHGISRFVSWHLGRDSGMISTKGGVLIEPTENR